MTYLEHLCNLAELFNVDIVEDDFSIVFFNEFLHNGTEDNTWSAPWGWTLENYWCFWVNNLIPFVHGLHFANAVNWTALLFLFISLRSKVHLLTLDHHLVLLWWNSLLIGSSSIDCTSWALEECSHLSFHCELWPLLLDKVLEESLLHVHLI